MFFLKLTGVSTLLCTRLIRPTRAFVVEHSEITLYVKGQRILSILLLFSSTSEHMHYLICQDRQDVHTIWYYYAQNTRDI